MESDTGILHIEHRHVKRCLYIDAARLIRFVGRTNGRRVYIIWY